MEDNSMQKVIRTIHGNAESVDSLNVYLNEGWHVVSSVLLPAYNDNVVSYKNVVEYLIEKDDD